MVIVLVTHPIDVIEVTQKQPPVIYRLFQLSNLIHKE
jgi:hypothetical protein